MMMMIYCRAAPALWCPFQRLPDILINEWEATPTENFKVIYKTVCNISNASNNTMSSVTDSSVSK